MFDLLLLTVVAECHFIYDKQQILSALQCVLILVLGNQLQWLTLQFLYEMFRFVQI